MAGYAAATAHRGIRLIRMPTTILSQNDSGVGVKNSVNKFGKKNFLGTFAPPYAVINDASLITKLPDREWRGGISEAIKVALLKDPEFFSFIEEHAARLRDRDARRRTGGPRAHGRRFAPEARGHGVPEVMTATATGLSVAPFWGSEPSTVTLSLSLDELREDTEAIAYLTEVAAPVPDKKSQIHVYEGMPHAFNADYRPSYRKEAADDGWKRMLAWFKKNGVA